MNIPDVKEQKNTQLRNRIADFSDLNQGQISIILHQRIVLSLDAFPWLVLSEFAHKFVK